MLNLPSPRECELEILVDFVDATDGASDIAWTLRAEVITALEQLGWKR